MKISLIAALSTNRVIGRDNALPWKISADLKRFKALTLGHPIIMGRKTFESIGRPLPGRLNLVISRSAGSRPWGAGTEGPFWCASLKEALSTAQKQPAPASEVFVIGGAEIYQQALPWADRLYLTLIHQEFDGDAYFPAWARESYREIERENRNEGDLSYSFVTLERHSTSEALN
jgi:dihydrofolate reductase